jgi:hypothetical protein
VRERVLKAHERESLVLKHVSAHTSAYLSMRQHMRARAVLSCDAIAVTYVARLAKPT